MKILLSVHRLSIVCLVAGLVLFFALPADAAPLAAKQIPAQAEGVIHVDVERLRTSSLWKLVEDNLPKPAKGKNLSDSIVDTLKTMNDEGIETLLSILISDVRGITIWGVDEDQWAMNIDLPIVASLLPVFESTIGFKKSTKKGVTLYRWEKEAVVAIQGSHLIVGTDAKSVITSARLMAGKGRSISGKKMKGLSSSAKGIIVVAGFGGKLMKAISKEAASKVLKTDIRSMLFLAGEHGNRFYVQAEAAVDSSQTAQKLVAVVTGLRAMLALSGDSPEIKALLSGLTISAKGSTMHVRVEVPVKTVLDMAK